MTTITRLKVDSKTAPLLVDPARPRFSWAWDSEDHPLVQASYRIVVSQLTPSVEAEHVVWDSGVTLSDETIGIPLEAGPLKSGCRYRWRVEAQTTRSRVPVVSPWAEFTTAPAPELWEPAQWITIRRDDHQHDDHRPLPHLRRLVTPTREVSRALLYSTAGGIHQVWIDAQMVGQSSFSPGWTDYDTRVPFHVHDVTEHCVNERPVHIGAIVADGWYAGGVGPFHLRNHWGKHPVWRAVLVLEYVDGSTETIPTDTSWEGAFGSILSSDLLQGEVVDARAALGDWSSGAAAPGWRPVTVEAGPTGKLVPAKVEPPAAFQELPALARTEPISGSHVFDFGQNFAGHVRLRVPDAPAGTMIRLRHGEALDDDGSIYVANLRGARATDTFIHDGNPAVFEPCFTYHGFRYVEITGYPGEPPLDAVTGIAVSSIAAGTSSFECSSPMINRLYRNIDWTMRSNFFDVPTDCPSRDERLAWTGDAQIFAPTATYYADVVNFFDKWLDDVLDASLNGIFPDIAPGKVLDRPIDGSSGYAEAGLIIPWLVYERFGDSRLIEVAYEAGARWVAYVRDRTDDLVWRRDRNVDYGDWLAPVETPKDLTATAYFALSAQLMERFANVLGREREALAYRQLTEDIAAAFRAAFVDADGTMPAGTQTAYTLALNFELLLPNQRDVAAAALAADVDARGGLSTGFLSVARLLPVLTSTGRPDVAYRLLLNEEYPSWGHQIRHGATSIWERWDGWRPETGFQDPLMNSFNHFALGSVGEWLFTGIGGIHPDAPGYRRIRLAPQISRELSWAKVAHDSPNGRIRVEWELAGEVCQVRLEVPANTRALVELPFIEGATRELGSGEHLIEGKLRGVA